MVFTYLFVHLLGCQSRVGFHSEPGGRWWDTMGAAGSLSGPGPGACQAAMALFKSACRIEHRCFVFVPDMKQVVQLADML